MTRDSEFLDQQWDDLVRGREPHDIDPTLRQIHAQRSAEPSPLFVSQLRSMIEVVAQEMPRARRAVPAVSLRVAADEPKVLPHPAQPRRQAGSMRGLSFAGNIASAVMAAALLIAMVAAVARYPFGGSGDTDNPATGSQGTSIAAPASPTATDGESGVSSADPGRTGVQPGPGPLGVPVIVGTADIGGSAMAIGGGAIVVVDGSKISALDAISLEQRWSVDLASGLYTTPVIAGDAVYFGYTENKEGYTEYTLGPDHNNQLVSFSMADGSVNWRIDGAGTFPYEPIIVDGTIFAAGSDGDAYLLRALDPTDGREIWSAEPFENIEFKNTIPPVGTYLDLTLAYGDGMIAVNQFYDMSVYDAANGDQVWSRSIDTPYLVGQPLIAGESVITTIVRTPMEDGEPADGNVVAFKLQTGDEQWSQNVLAGYTFGSASSDGLILAGQMKGEDAPGLVRFSVDAGEAVWSASYRDTAIDSSPDTWPARDAVTVTGQDVYTLAQASDAGKSMRTLVTARDITTGEADWTVILDGIARSAPIIAGGKIYVLTDLYGLQVLGDDPDTHEATSDGAVVDLRTPLNCAARPIDYPLPGLPEEETPAEPAYPGWREVMPLADVPDVDPARAVTLEVQAAIAELMTEFRNCNLQGDHQLLFSFYSDAYYLRLRDVDPRMLEGKNGESGWMAVMIAGSSERLDLDVATLQTWPDGRIGGLLRGNMDVYMWFVEEDGEWKIDEFHRIMDISTDPEPSPSS